MSHFGCADCRRKETIKWNSPLNVGKKCRWRKGWLIKGPIHVNIEGRIPLHRSGWPRWKKWHNFFHGAVHFRDRVPIQVQDAQMLVFLQGGLLDVTLGTNFFHRVVENTVFLHPLDGHVIWQIRLMWCLAQATYFANLLLSDKCLEILLQIRRGGNDVLSKKICPGLGRRPPKCTALWKKMFPKSKKHAIGIKHRRRTLFFQTSRGLRNIVEDFTQDGVDRLLGETLTCP